MSERLKDALWVAASTAIFGFAIVAAVAVVVAALAYSGPGAGVVAMVVVVSTIFGVAKYMSESSDE